MAPGRVKARLASRWRLLRDGPHKTRPGRGTGPRPGLDNPFIALEKTRASALQDAQHVADQRMAHDIALIEVDDGDAGDRLEAPRDLVEPGEPVEQVALVG